MCYLPLVVCKSHYSFMKGIHSIPELVEFAVQHNLESLCLADEEGLYGAVEFFTSCQEAGIKPLIGVELAESSHVVIVIAKNEEGYKNLSKIITDLQVNKVKLMDALKPENNNLLILCNDSFLLSQWKKNENIGSVYLAPIVSDAKALQSLLIFISRWTDILHRFPAIPIVKLNVFSKNELILYRLIRAIAQNRTLESFQSEEAIVFTDFSGPYLPFKPIVSSQEVAKMCSFEFDFSQYFFPHFVIPET
ncbi:MAG: hypothetical protein CMG75_04185 [Candidatus Marinimicrobia bacterium]|nr:hypothetical protein [Candidatus Neomarinimicrobiota bacterium]